MDDAMLMKVFLLARCRDDFDHIPWRIAAASGAIDLEQHVRCTRSIEPWRR